MALGIGIGRGTRTNAESHGTARHRARVRSAVQSGEERRAEQSSANELRIAEREPNERPAAQSDSAEAR